MKRKTADVPRKHEGTRTRYSNVMVIQRAQFDEHLRYLEVQEDRRVGHVENAPLDLESRGDRVAKMLEAIEDAAAERFYESDMRDCQREADAVVDDASEMRFLEMTRRVMLSGGSDFAEAFLEYGKCLRRFVQGPADFPARDGEAFRGSAERQHRLIGNVVWSATVARRAKSERTKLATAGTTLINTAELMRAIVLGDMHNGLAGKDPKSYSALKRFLSLRWGWKIKAGLFDVRNALVHGDAQFTDTHATVLVGARRRKLTAKDLLRYANIAAVAWSAVMLHVLFSRAWARTGNPWFSPAGRISWHAPRTWKRQFPQWTE